MDTKKAYKKDLNLRKGSLNESATKIKHMEETIAHMRDEIDEIRTELKRMRDERYPIEEPLTSTNRKCMRCENVKPLSSFRPGGCNTCYTCKGRAYRANKKARTQ